MDRILEPVFHKRVVVFRKLAVVSHNLEPTGTEALLVERLEGMDLMATDL